MRKPIPVLLLSALLAGCAVNQPQPPQLDLPAPSATAAQNALLERWWTAFDDPALTALIDEAFANNLDLRGALARIEAARALLLLSQSNLAPSINLRGSAARSRDSQSTTQAIGQPSFGAGNNYGVGIEMSLRARRLGQVPQRRPGRDQRPLRVPVLPRDRPHHGRSRRRQGVFQAARRRRAGRGARRHEEVPDRHRGAAARPFRGRHHRRIRPAPGRGRAFRRRRRHRARAPVDRPPRIGARHADGPLAARRVHAGDRARRVDRGRDGRAAAAVGTAVGLAGTAPGHPSRRGHARRIGPARPAGARRLFSEPRR